MTPVFVLLTDFGLSDPYLGQLKAVLISRTMACQILDIAHNVRPQDVLQGGFFLAASWPYLPQGCICLAVVDPEVGTNRRILVLAKEGRLILAPDNGLLTQVMDLPGQNTLYQARDIPDSQQGSCTFQGRDVFAPLAADLAREKDPAALACSISEQAVQRLSLAKPRLEQGLLYCRVQHVDHFGNCILTLNISKWSSRLMEGRRPGLREPVQGQVCPAWSYAQIDKGQIGLLPGSQGFLELALDRASCAKALGIMPGSEVVFEFQG